MTRSSEFLRYRSIFSSTRRVLPIACLSALLLWGCGDDGGQDDSVDQDGEIGATDTVDTQVDGSADENGSDLDEGSTATTTNTQSNTQTTQSDTTTVTGTNTATDTGQDNSDESAEDTTDTATTTDSTTETTSSESTSSESTSSEENLCDASADVVLYLSPDDSNSMSSPVQVRQRVLEEGSRSLYDIGIRTWEFLNYYQFNYKAAAPGELELDASMAAGADEGTYELQLAVTSEAMTNETRPKMHLTLVLDTSGSMQGTPMNLLKASCRAMLSKLREGDTLSVVDWNTSNNVRLSNHVISGANDEAALTVINALEAGGGTDLYSGLSAGYEVAQQVFQAKELNRMVLISDGGANAGITDIQLIAQNAKISGEDGIYLVGAGVAGGSYNDGLMDAVTDAGKGASAFISSVDEANKIFSTNFINTMAVAARDVQLQLTLPPGFKLKEFSGEEASGDPHEVEPQHLAPNDSMVFYQQIETCAPELAGPAAEIRMRVTYKDAVTFEPKVLEKIITFESALAQEQQLLRKGAAIYQYAKALQSYRSQQTDQLETIEAARNSISNALISSPADADLLEVQSIADALWP